MDENSVSITIKGIPRTVRDTFSDYCVFCGKNMQEVLRDFICGVYVPSEQERAMMKYRTVHSLLSSNPEIIDQYINEHEPFFNLLTPEQKVSFRSQFAYVNQNVIFNYYRDLLNKEE